MAARYRWKRELPCLFHGCTAYAGRLWVAGYHISASAMAAQRSKSEPLLGGLALPVIWDNLYPKWCTVRTARGCCIAYHNYITSAHDTITCRWRHSPQAGWRLARPTWRRLSSPSYGHLHSHRLQSIEYAASPSPSPSSLSVCTAIKKPHLGRLMGEQFVRRGPSE